jgi:DNA-binding transcriptional ArsR family regulator
MKSIKNTTPFMIKDLDTLKVIADPLRFQLLELLALEPMTVKQLAEKLGLAPSKLYYHVNMLEDYGLIEVADTRIVSGIIEKHYSVISDSVDILPELLSFTSQAGRENINTLLISTIDATREDLLRSLQARAFELDQGASEQTRHVMINRTLSRLPEEQAEEFIHKLKNLMDEFDSADSSGDNQAFALTIAYYPTFYYKELDASVEDEQHG